MKIYPFLRYPNTCLDGDYHQYILLSLNKRFSPKPLYQLRQSMFTEFVNQSLIVDFQASDFSLHNFSTKQIEKKGVVGYGHFVQFSISKSN